MKVMVHLVNGNNETQLVGDSPIFGSQVDYRKGVDTRLRDIGFWLGNWSYVGQAGPKHKSRVFVPWSSALYIVEMGKDELQ